MGHESKSHGSGPGPGPSMSITAFRFGGLHSKQVLISVVLKKTNIRVCVTRAKSERASLAIYSYYIVLDIYRCPQEARFYILKK